MLGQTICRLSFARSNLFQIHRRTFKRTSFSNQQQQNINNDSKDLAVDMGDDGHKFDVKEEEKGISGFEQSEPVIEKPLLALGIPDRMKKMSKIGSLSIDMFAGNYDADFLTYPECLDNRKESSLIYEQSKMVFQLWPKIWNKPDKLQQFNFHNLYELSVTEMMTVLEAIGASTRRCYETNFSKPIHESSLFLPQDKNSEYSHVDVTKSILSLIIRNCLTYYPLRKSSNGELRNRLLPHTPVDFRNQKHEGMLPPIGFAYSERAPNFGSLPSQEWSTMGLDDSDGKSWLITGKKTKILLEDGVENYLVFFRDKLLASKIGIKAKDQEPNPASDPLVGACIVKRENIKSISPAYYDSAGLKYVDIELDTMVPKDFEVFPAQRKSAWPLNIKGLGQLGTSAAILGMLKDTLRRTYKYLLDNKRGLLDCDLVRSKLTETTNKIFAIESLVYFVAGMYDGLDDGFDGHIEAAITKVLAIEYGYEILRNLQQICGSDLFLTSRLQDQLNIMDSFMDGCLHNRIYIATLGVFWFARQNHVHLSQMRLSYWYPGYITKMNFKEVCERNDWLTLDSDIKGNLHPRLENSAIRLEFILKRVQFATDLLCRRHGMETPSKQCDLVRLAQMVIDSFMLTAVLARSSRSFCNGTQNGEIETISADILSAEAVRSVRMFMTEIEALPFEKRDDVSEIINTMNLRFGGYYARPPIDVNI